MVEFSEYVGIAYDVAKSQAWYDRQMRGEGSQAAHQRFMSDLADVYNRLDHDQATASAARRFLEENVGPP